MAKYDITPVLNLKKTRRGEREWTDNERENWDKIDQFAQIILSNPPEAGTPQPIFNNTYTSLSITGILDPSSVVFTYNANNEIIEAVEQYANTRLPRRITQYMYYEDTRLLSTVIESFDGIRTTTTITYDANGNLASTSSVEEVIE